MSTEKVVPSSLDASATVVAAVPVDTAGSRRRDVTGLARGGGFLAAGSFLEFILRFFIGFLLARLLGPTDFGLYNLATVAAGLFAAISSFGLEDAMVRYVAMLSARRDKPGVWGTIQIGVCVALPTNIVTGVVLYVMAPIVAEGLFSEPLLTPALQLMAFAVPCLALSNILLGVTLGFGRMDHAALGENVIQAIVRVILLSGLALSHLDLRAALVVFIVGDISSSVTMGILIHRRFSLRPRDHHEVRRDVAETLRFSLPFWLSGLLSKLQKNISALVLGSTTTIANVGIFAIVTNLNLIGHALYRAVSLAAKPLLVQLSDRGDRVGLAHVYTTTTRWLLLTNIPFVLAMTLYPESILAIFGDSFVVAASALIVMSIAELVNAGTGICGSLIDMTGHTRVKLLNSVLWLVLAIGGNALLIPRFGVLGAAYAYLICVSVVNAARMLEIWILERVVPSWRAFAKPLVAGVSAMVLGVGLKAFWPVEQKFVPALVQGAIVGVVFLALVVLLGVDDDDRHILTRALAKFR